MTWSMADWQSTQVAQRTRTVTIGTSGLFPGWPSFSGGEGGGTAVVERLATYAMDRFVWNGRQRESSRGSSGKGMVGQPTFGESAMGLERHSSHRSARGRSYRLVEDRGVRTGSDGEVGMDSHAEVGPAA